MVFGKRPFPERLTIISSYIYMYVCIWYTTEQLRVKALLNSGCWVVLRFELKPFQAEILTTELPLPLISLLFFNIIQVMLQKCEYIAKIMFVDQKYNMWTTCLLWKGWKRRKSLFQFPIFRWNFSSLLCVFDMWLCWKSFMETYQPCLNTVE